MPSSGGPGGQWNVAALLDRRPAAPPKSKRARGARFESRFEYLVQWEDRDPTTGEPYEPTWEPTTYITPAAIESYYIEKYEAAGAQLPGNDDDAAAAATAGDVPAPASKPATQEKAVKVAGGVPAKAVKTLAPVPTIAAQEKVIKAAAGVPAKGDDESVPRRPKNAHADEDAPKRQRSARTANSSAANSSTADQAKGKQSAEDAAAVAAPAPRKRGTSPTPDKENTKRIRVADMLLL